MVGFHNSISRQEGTRKDIEITKEENGTIRCSHETKRRCVCVNTTTSTTV